MSSPRLEEALAPRPKRLTGALAPGTSLLTTVVAEETVRITGASSVRVRFNATKAGTLYVAVLKHDQTTEELAPAPRTVPVLDATEVTVGIDGLVGESYLLIRFTAGAATSVITYVDLYRSFFSGGGNEGGGATVDMAIPAGSGAFAPEIIYLNRGSSVAGVAAPSDLQTVRELIVYVGAVVATVSVEIDLLKAGGDPGTAGDWIIAAQAYTTAGLKAVENLVDWDGVRIRGKSGGTSGTQSVTAFWR